MPVERGPRPPGAAQLLGADRQGGRRDAQLELRLAGAPGDEERRGVPERHPRVGLLPGSEAPIGVVRPRVPVAEPRVVLAVPHQARRRPRFDRQDDGGPHGGPRPRPLLQLLASAGLHASPLRQVGLVRHDLLDRRRRPRCHVRHLFRGRRAGPPRQLRNLLGLPPRLRALLPRLISPRADVLLLVLRPPALVRLRTLLARRPREQGHAHFPRRVDPPRPRRPLPTRRQARLPQPPRGHLRVSELPLRLETRVAPLHRLLREGRPLRKRHPRRRRLRRRGRPRLCPRPRRRGQRRRGQRRRRRRRGRPRRRCCRLLPFESQRRRAQEEAEDPVLPRLLRRLRQRGGKSCPPGSR
mmetsp:Transcript_28114/g.90624  ORF Transcript_28114/g.90624 Transcript_28114/m.90624 type:complete len:354 (+) Transcript_28114:854-1915(+)